MISHRPSEKKRSEGLFYLLPNCFIKYRGKKLPSEAAESAPDAKQRYSEPIIQICLKRILTKVNLFKYYGGQLHTLISDRGFIRRHPT